MANKPRSNNDLRLPEIGNELMFAVRPARPDLVVIEDLAGVYPGKSARIIPMLHGVIRDRLQQDMIPFMVLNPRTVKIFATGNGGADKDDMALSARRRLGRTYETDDECDADWCRVAGRVAYGLGELTGYDDWLRMPAEQVGYLRVTKGGERITWPVVGNHRPWPKVVLR